MHPDGRGDRQQRQGDQRRCDQPRCGPEGSAHGGVSPGVSPAVSPAVSPRLGPPEGVEPGGYGGGFGEKLRPARPVLPDGDLPGVLLEVQFREGDEELFALFEQAQDLGIRGARPRGLRRAEEGLHHERGGGAGEHRQQDQHHSGIASDPLGGAPGKNSALVNGCARLPARSGRPPRAAVPPLRGRRRPRARAASGAAS